MSWGCLKETNSQTERDSKSRKGHSTQGITGRKRLENTKIVCDCWSSSSRWYHSAPSLCERRWIIVSFPSPHQTLLSGSAVRHYHFPTPIKERCFKHENHLELVVNSERGPCVGRGPLAPLARSVTDLSASADSRHLIKSWIYTKGNDTRFRDGIEKSARYCAERNEIISQEYLLF